MMTSSAATLQTLSHRLLAFTVLCAALIFAFIGIMRWPILIYAAAPCFFLSSVGFIGFFSKPKRSKKRLLGHTLTMEHIECGGWF